MFKKIIILIFIVLSFFAGRQSAFKENEERIDAIAQMSVSLIQNEITYACNRGIVEICHLYPHLLGCHQQQLWCEELARSELKFIAESLRQDASEE